MCPGTPSPSIGGNAGNVAVALAHLGMNVELVSAWGDDSFGDWLATMLEEHHVSTTRVPPSQTSVNLVMTDQTGQRLSAFHPVQLDTAAIIDVAQDVTPRHGDYIVLAGFPHPTIRAMSAWAERGRQVGANVALDIGPSLARLTAHHLSGLLPFVDLLLANEDELRACVAGSEPAEAAHFLAATHSLEVVVKSGRAGSRYVSSVDDLHVPSQPVSKGVVTVGAGDTFNAGLLYARASGASPADALRYGTATALLMLQRGGGVLASPTKEEVERALHGPLAPSPPDANRNRTTKEHSMSQLPKWASQLMEQHPGAEMPDRENPVPEWLARETQQTPLWYIIRGASETRSEHPFLLHKEIHRQPGQWQEILDGCWGEVSELAEQYAGSVNQIITTGCGSAFFTALHGAFTLPRLTGIRAQAIESFELAHYFPDVDPASTLVIGHSGTGGSIETVEAMDAARKRGCQTLAMTNTEDTAVGRASDRTLTYVTSQECGPCTSVVSTRVLLASMLGISVGERRGYAIDFPALRDALADVPTIGRTLLQDHESTVADLAARYRDAESWMLVGSGPNYFSAREGTLKIEEQAILVAKPYRTGDFHHDALSLVSPERTVIGIEAAGDANDRVVDALRAAREGGAPTVAVTWSNVGTAENLAAVADHRVALQPSVPEVVSPLAMTLVFQLLGYYLGVARGFNPDTLRTDHEPNTRAWLTSFPLGTH
jgi:sugar/nucleoside kinase (ribokinase family)/fructoselysine-6-P-deglycase FrlB-like protein